MVLGIAAFRPGRVAEMSARRATNGGRETARRSWVSMRVRMTFTLCVLLAAGLATPAARADTIITGYGGIVFGGDLDVVDGDDADIFDFDGRHGVYGLNLA